MTEKEKKEFVNIHFRHILESNINMMKNQILNTSEGYLASKNFTKYPEDKVSSIAVSFFTKEISKRLTELTESNLFITEHS